MKVLALALLGILLFSTVAAAQVWVDPYSRKDGTQVQGHWRSSPDSTIQNNYSFPGNYNPNTGRTSTGDPYKIDRNRDGVPDMYQPAPRTDPFGLQGGRPVTPFGR